MLHDKCNTPISYRLFREEGDEVLESEIAYGFKLIAEFISSRSPGRTRNRLIVEVPMTLGTGNGSHFPSALNLSPSFINLNPSND
jgi:hypothetical protein